MVHSHTFACNCQQPFLNRRKGRMTVENSSWSISTKLWGWTGIKLTTPGSAIRLGNLRLGTESTYCIMHGRMQKILSGGPDIFFSHQRISQRAVRTSLEAAGSKGSNCFSMGVRTSIIKEIYSYLWFFRGSGSQYPPSGSAHVTGHVTQ